MRLTSLAFAILVLYFGAAGLFAQGAQLTAAINANLVIITPFQGINGSTTPAFAPAGGVASVQAGIRAVQTALNGQAIGAQVISVTIGGVNITWGHDVGGVGAAGNGEIAVSTGANGAAGAAGADASVTITNTLCSGYAVGGNGSAANGRGGDATVAITGVDGRAEAYGGDGVGTGRGGHADADAAPGGVGDIGDARAVGGNSVGAVAAGNGTAKGDGNATALGGNGDPTVASTGGNAVAMTSNGNGVGATSNATAGSAQVGGVASAFGPNNSQINVQPTGGTGNNAVGN